MKSIIVLALLSITPASLPAADSVRPNVIIIYTDDQGYGDASCLNPDAKFKTPNLDRLAREGITFTDGHCSDTVCTPSRYGLLTGRYSWRTELKRGVFGAERPCLIAEVRMTLASLLRDHRYQTAMVGKWHLGMDFPGDRTTRDWSQPVKDMPLDKGFDYFWGIPASMNYGVLAWFEGRHAKVPPTQYTQKKPNKIALSDYRIMPPYDKTAKVAPADKAGKVRGKLEVAPDFIDIECLDRFTTKAIEWMSKRDKDKPFFLYLPYTSPHKPVIPMKRFRGQGKAGAYGEFMIETDWHVGRILDFLDQERLAENTLLVFTSDNGPETTWKQRAAKFNHQSNGQYREGKRSIYEGGHRVPLFIRWPAGIAKPGRSYHGPVCQTDLLATFAEMLGARLPAGAGEDSQSFFKVLKKDTTLKRVPMIHHSSSGGFAIRDGKWKLVMGARRSRKRELYDLSSDPGESNNVITEHPDIAKRLEQALSRIVVNGRSTPGDPVSNDTGYWNDLFWMDENDYVR
jgi:arylsulfatase A